MRQNVCGKTWTPRLSVRLLWLLHLTLGCPVPVPSISLCMNPEKCIYCTNAMKLLFTWLPIIYQPGYHTPTAFAVDASPCSLYAREKKNPLAIDLQGFLANNWYSYPLVCCDQQLLAMRADGQVAPLPSSVQWCHIGGLKAAIVGVFSPQKLRNAKNQGILPPPSINGF